MLKPNAMEFLPPRDIKPLGWLRRQLEIQANGLSGNLDKIWPDVRDSRWVGGDKEGWERVPYWLDGFIPLAYLLDDKDMQDRAAKYMDAILSRQQKDGWICPCAPEERGGYDMWALILIAKVMVVYAECSGDERIVPTLTAALRNFNDHINSRTLFNWGASRWFEALIPIFWLYEKTGAEWLLDLAQKLEVQGIDYQKIFEHYRDMIPQRRWTYLTHIVNLSMCLKAGALTSRLHGGDPGSFAKLAVETLDKYHGMACGHFTGDECVSGDSPVQGTELCGVVEAMYSYEQLLAITGDPYWGDRLERLAFNALPATISEDMWTHQYDQQTNQVQCSRLPDGHVVFRTNSGESHLFGLEPNYGCCTANFNQGWPKFALAAFMRTPGGLASVIPVPSEARVDIGGTEVKCRLDTNYPFKNVLIYTIDTEKPVEFEFSIRIPGTAAAAYIDGAPVKCGEFYRIKRMWSGRSRIEVKLNFECSLVKRPRGMACLWRGPLLYSLELNEEWKRLEYTRHGVERKFPYCDYELYTDSEWGFGFAGGGFEVHENEVSDTPFSHSKPPVVIETDMYPLDWKLEYGVCAVEPSSRKPIGPAVKKRFIPYGCARLRMTEMPEKCE